jgi:ABC-type methionine transport system ATPase subunit
MDDQRTIFYTDHVPPLRASDVAKMINGELIEPDRVVEIFTEAARSVAGVLARHHWDTDAEQRAFNIFRSVIYNSSKIIRGN